MSADEYDATERELELREARLALLAAEPGLPALRAGARFLTAVRAHSAHLPRRPGVGVAYLPHPGGDEYPAVRVGELLVFVYVDEDGTHRITIDCEDTTAPTPLRIVLNNEDLWSGTLPVGKCECDDDPVPGALLGMNGRDEIQRCTVCARFDSDREAADAVADAIGGDAVSVIDYSVDRGEMWSTVERDGARLTANHIRRELTP